MGNSHWRGPLNIRKADGTVVEFVDENGKIVADITAPAGSIGLSELATIIQPSHVVKIAGNETWSGAGATLAASVAGTLSTDIVMATIKTKPTEAAYLVAATPTTDTITFELSAANTSNDAVISYTVFRATS